MYTFILLSLFFLPMFNAIRYETELDSNEELFVPHSAAANYLCMCLKEKQIFVFLSNSFVL